jgi:hypothetical protein
MAPGSKPPIRRAIVLILGLLVVGGVGLGIAMEAGIIEPTRVLRWLAHFPLALRLVVYVQSSGCQSESASRCMSFLSWLIWLAS